MWVPHLTCVDVGLYLSEPDLGYEFYREIRQDVNNHSHAYLLNAFQYLLHIFRKVVEFGGFREERSSGLQSIWGAETLVNIADNVCQVFDLHKPNVQRDE